MKEPLAPSSLPSNVHLSVTAVYLMDFNYDMNMTRSDTSPNAVVTWEELPFRACKVPSTSLDLDTASSRPSRQTAGYSVLRLDPLYDCLLRSLERCFVFIAIRTEAACKYVEAEKGRDIYILQFRYWR